VDDLLQMAERRADIGRTTVYRTLKLQAAGLARSCTSTASRLSAVQAEHHDHFICKSCGAISEFVNADIERIRTRSPPTSASHRGPSARIYGFAAAAPPARRAPKLDAGDP
jgi:Fe2+ or Zn2+ uptake regulation protein